jgi:hypothetical protein
MSIYFNVRYDRCEHGGVAFARGRSRKGKNTMTMNEIERGITAVAMQNVRQQR